MDRDSYFKIAEQDVEAAIAHYAEWPNFPNFTLPERDRNSCTHYFMNLFVRRLAERSGHLSGAGHAEFAEQVFSGEFPNSISMLLVQAAEVVSAAIAQVPYESEIGIGGLPSSRLHPPVEFVQGPSQTFFWACGQTDIELPKLQSLSASLCVWSICWAGQAASSDVHEAEDWLSEAFEFLTVAERCDAIRSQRKWVSDKGNKKRNKLASSIQRDAYRLVYVNRNPEETQWETAERISSYVDSLPEGARIDATKPNGRQKPYALTPDRAYDVVKEWSYRESRGLPAIEPDESSGCS